MSDSFPLSQRFCPTASDGIVCSTAYFTLLISTSQKGFASEHKPCRGGMLGLMRANEQKKGGCTRLTPFVSFCWIQCLFQRKLSVFHCLDIAECIAAKAVSGRKEVGKVAEVQ